MPIVRKTVPARHGESANWRPSVGLVGVALALLLAACGASGTPAPSAGANEATLVPAAAVSATVGPEGGELTASDPERGRSYHLTIPEGAFPEATTVTATPIASIDGFPLDGGILGGLELQPEGATFLAPVTLEIALDADQQAALRTALDADEVVVGFHYSTDPSDLSFTPADVADDRSSITLTLFGFSGNGGGKGKPGGLHNRPCPTDPAQQKAQCEIAKILHPPGGPADLSDPAVWDQIDEVFRDWLILLEFRLDIAADDPDAYKEALSEAFEWHALAAGYGLLSAQWYAAGDELASEGSELGESVKLSFLKALDAANTYCKTTSDLRRLDDLIALLDLHELAARKGWPMPLLSTSSALSPANLCVQFTLTLASSAPTAIDEGQSTRIEVELHPEFSGGVSGVFSDQEGDKLLRWAATPRNSSLLTIDRVDYLGAVFQVYLTAKQSVAGRDDEGTFDLDLFLPWSLVRSATLNVPLDIEPPPVTPPPPITCLGDPGTITHRAERKIAIVFDGAGCAVIPGLSDDDNPNVAIVLDTEAGQATFNAGTGSNWKRKSLGDGESPGIYAVTIARTNTSQVFTLNFTVDIAVLSGGDVRLTVRDVSITVGAAS